MQNPLDKTLAPEKVKDLFLLLKDSPKEVDSILRPLGTTKKELLPQMRFLEESRLVKLTGNTYELTAVGKLIIDKCVSSEDTVETFEYDVDYWAQRNLDFIPAELTGRILDLEAYIIYRPSLTEVNQVVRELFQTSIESNSFYAVTNTSHPDFSDRWRMLLQNNVKMQMIITKPLFEKVKTRYRDNFQQLLNHEIFHCYLYDQAFPSLYFAVNDHLILLAMLTRECSYDERALISYSSTARQWGKDLFDYYLKDSTPITEI